MILREKRKKKGSVKREQEREVYVNVSKSTTLKRFKVTTTNEGTVAKLSETKITAHNMKRRNN